MDKILLFLSIKYKGDWDQIYKALDEKESPDFDEIKALEKNLKCKYLTILDINYPKLLKNMYKPPFVIFYKGDINCINVKKIIGFNFCNGPSDYAKNHGLRILEELGKGNHMVLTIFNNASNKLVLKTLLKLDKPGIGVASDGIYNLNENENNDFNKQLLISEYYYPSNVTDIYLQTRLMMGLIGVLFLPEIDQNAVEIINSANNEGINVGCLPFPLDIKNSNNQFLKQGLFLIENGIDILNNL